MTDIEFSNDGFNLGRNISEMCLEISKLIKHSNISAETSFKIDDLLWKIAVRKRRIYNTAINDYKKCLLQRLILHLDDLGFAKDSETYYAITEIAEDLKIRNQMRK